MSPKIATILLSLILIGASCAEDASAGAKLPDDAQKVVDRLNQKIAKAKEEMESSIAKATSTAVRQMDDVIKEHQDANDPAGAAAAKAIEDKWKAPADGLKNPDGDAPKGVAMPLTQDAYLALATNENTTKANKEVMAKLDLEAIKKLSDHDKKLKIVRVEYDSWAQTYADAGYDYEKTIKESIEVIQKGKSGDFDESKIEIAVQVMKGAYAICDDIPPSPNGNGMNGDVSSLPPYWVTAVNQYLRLTGQSNLAGKSP